MQTSKLIAGACLALTLNGCVLLHRKIEYRYVSTACLTHEQFDKLKAEEPEKIHSRLSGDADHDSKILAGSLIRVRAYADGMLEILGGCTEPDTHKIADKLLNDAQ